MLGTLAWLSPLPDRVTDRDVYETTAARVIVPDCTDLHCFRVLVAWTLGELPGPSTLKWRTYAVVCNAAAALMVLQLCLTFGLSPRAAWIASLLSAFGFGSLYTLHDSYTSDPLMFALGPLMMNELLRSRFAVAGAIGAIGVLAKEFAAAPLYLFAMYEASEKRWQGALRGLVTANAAFIVWAILHLTLIIRFNYGYGGTSSNRFLSGGAFWPWLAGTESSRRAFGDVQRVRRAVPARAGRVSAGAHGRCAGSRSSRRRSPLVFCYVQQPDRALWNFHFLDRAPRRARPRTRIHAARRPHTRPRSPSPTCGSARS